NRPYAAVNVILFSFFVVLFDSMIPGILLDRTIPPNPALVHFFSRAYITETAITLIFGLLILSFFSIKEGQLKVGIVLCFAIFAGKLFFLASRLFAGSFFRVLTYSLFSLVFLLLSAVLSYLIHRLSGYLLNLAETSLNEAKDFNQKIINASPDGFILNDLTGIIAYASPKTAKMFGFKDSSGITGRSIYEFIVPGDRKKLTANFKLAVRNEPAEDTEYRVLQKDGDEFIADIRTAVVADAWGNPKGLISISRDVTHAKKAERELRDSQVRYKNLFESSPIPLSAEDWSEVRRFFDILRNEGVTDFRTWFDEHPEGIVHCLELIRIRECNQANLQLLKAGSREEMAAGVKKIIGEDAYPVLKEEFTAIAEGALQFTAEQVSHTLDGRKLDCIVHVNVSPGHEENLENVLVSMVDITARKQAEEALIRQDHVLNGVNRAVEAVISETDYGRALEILGRTMGVDRVSLYRNEKDEAGKAILHPISGWSYDGAGTPEKKGETGDLPYRRQLAGWLGGMETGNEIEGFTGDFPPEEREILEARNILSLLVLQVPVKTLFWGLLVLEDCSEKRSWPESEKRIINAFAVTLGEVIARHEAAMELVKARDQAEAATKSKSEFLANMSHEIRTPMNAIIGMAGLALEKEKDSRVKEYLKIINKSSHSLLGIINDILDFSKIEAGKMDIETIGFYLSDLLDELSDMFRSKAAEKDIELVIIPDLTAPDALIGDPLRLSQIFINLISNAVKFTEKGEITVRAECILASPDKAGFRFSVRDTGIGIDNGKLPQLFDSFTQADGSTTRRFGGTGLGLAICRSLVENMGGTIQAESEPGRGSLFTFVLSLERQPQMNEKKRVIPETVSNLKILVVDDNAPSLLLITEMLASSGFSAGAAASGKEALDLLEEAQKGKAPFQLVLADWKMPGMDGIELVRAVKQRENSGGIRTILMTAFGTNRDIEDAGGAVADAFLLKPIKQSALYDAIINIFDPSPRLAAGGEIPLMTRERIHKEAVRGAQLLLVEDNRINQQVAVEILEEAGISVDLADDGREAVAAVRHKKYDAVLMDVQMPRMDGLEAAKLIRADENFADLPIIAMTANAMKGDRERCIAAGMNDYVSKPIDTAELFTVLKRWINLEGPGRIDTAQEGGELPEIPGINTGTALKRLMHNRKLLKSLLKDFKQDYGSAAETLRNLLGSGDLAGLEREAHSLKSVAGNVGAEGVSAAAAKLESAAREGKTSGLSPLIEDLGDRLAAVADAIGLMLPGEDPGNTPATGGSGRADAAAAAAIMEELYSLASGNDAEAEDKLELLKSCNLGGEYAGFLKKIEEELAEFNFAEAADLADKLRKKFEQSERGRTGGHDR
ncbi:MAG: response regulator, partial [Spirochaetales bacterium]